MRQRAKPRHFVPDAWETGQTELLKASCRISFPPMSLGRLWTSLLPRVACRNCLKVIHAQQRKLN